jgi:hypothetical protein
MTKKPQTKTNKEKKASNEKPNFSTKLSISDAKMDINLKFYYILKHLVKAHLTDNQVLELRSYLIGLDKKQIFDRQMIPVIDFIESIKAEKKRQEIHGILDKILTEQDLTLFVFGLDLYFIKDLLLKEAHIHSLNKQDILSSIPLLSLEYDNTTLVIPYTKRVHSALLALLFFDRIETQNLNFLTEEPSLLLKKMSQHAVSLKSQGLDSNQMFMLMFSESVNQSITSNSGLDYENRIRRVLVDAGVSDETIKKTHDANDKSTEFDFFFTLEGKTIGIGAKRTLRERYKQFIKTAHTSQLDVMICITLGVDATEDKVHTICSQHNVILFVADEIYEARPYLQNEANCYSVKDLTLKTLNKLVSDTP